MQPLSVVREECAEQAEPWESSVWLPGHGHSAPGLCLAARSQQVGLVVVQTSQVSRLKSLIP